MTLSTKILLSYLALGGGIGGIYIGVNGGIGNKAVEEIAESVETPDVVAQPPAPEKTDELVEDKAKGVGTEETLEVKKKEETKESATSDDATQQTKITDNGEDVVQDTDLELRVVEAMPIPNVEIQIAQTVPEIKYQRLQIETNPPTPKETKENVVSASIEAPLSNQTTPKTKATSDGTPTPSDGEKTGMAWIMGKAREYAEHRNKVTSIIETIRQSLN